MSTVMMKRGVLVANVPLGLWAFSQVLGTTWSAEDHTVVLVDYALWSLALPFGACLLLGYLAVPTAGFRITNTLLLSVLPYCGPYLALGFMGLPEVFMEGELQLLWWSAAGVLTGLVAVPGYFLPMLVAKSIAGSGTD